MNNSENLINFVNLCNPYKIKGKVEEVSEINLLQKFDNLSNDFNDLIKTKYKKEVLNNIIKEMRIIHGKIIKLFFDKLKDQGNFNHEEFYILSILESSYQNIRNVIKQAEDILLDKKTSLFDNVELNKEEINNKYNESFKKSIDNEIDVSLPTFILFYGDWCSHCRQFKPTWDAFYKIVDKKYLNVIKTDKEEFLDMFNVNGVPTIKYINGDKIIDYTNGRDIYSLTSFVNEINGKEIAKPF